MKLTSARKGFTLVELLVVIVIIAALASLAFAMSTRAILKSEKVKALQQMRDLSQGMEAYIIDYNGPPIPDSLGEVDRDMIYGPGQPYGNEEIVMTLFGDASDDNYLRSVNTQFAEEMNPKGDRYIRFPMADDERYGVADDGKLYDPWGTEIYIAINVHPPNSPMDKRILDTRGMAEWDDAKPRNETYATWSYGKDQKKGDSLVKSDDVAKW